MADPHPSLFLPTVVIDPAGDEGLAPLKKRCLDCTKCELSKWRTNAVFGEGNAHNPDICFIGEAPGSNEDNCGRPFVGRSGQLLDKMITAMGYTRSEVYLTNVVACWPPDNRPPEKKEIEACEEYWLGQIRAIRPQVIVGLGITAVSAMIGGRKKINEIRGRWLEYEGIPLMPTLHPSALVRAQNDPSYKDLKKMVWGDLQLVLAKLGKSVNPAKPAS